MRRLRFLCIGGGSQNSPRRIAGAGRKARHRAACDLDRKPRRHAGDAECARYRDAVLVFRRLSECHRRGDGVRRSLCRNGCRRHAAPDRGDRIRRRAARSAGAGGGVASVARSQRNASGSAWPRAPAWWRISAWIGWPNGRWPNCRRMSMRVAFPFVGDTIGGSHISAALLMAQASAARIFPGRDRASGRAAAAVPQATRPRRACSVDLPCLAPGAAGIPAVLKIVMIAPRLASFLRQNDFALVHANDGRMITGWMPGARLAGCRTVAHRRTRWSPSRLSDIAFSFAQKVIAISRYVETTLPDALRKKSVVIANPFDGTAISRGEARARAVGLVGKDALDSSLLSARCKNRSGPTFFCAPPPSFTGSVPTSDFLLIGRDGEEGAAARALCQDARSR